MTRPAPRRRSRSCIAAVLGALVLVGSSCSSVVRVGSGAAGIRRPPAKATWQWVLSEPFRMDDPVHLAPPSTVYDIDGFLNDARTVQALHDRGAYVICYVETGGWESYRPDASRYPPAVLGRAIDGYPEERYVDIRHPAVFEIVLDRLRMCADKGFDAVEPDLDDTYAEDTGFGLTVDDNVRFNERVARAAHDLGLAIALKNGDEGPFVTAMEPLVDFAVVEQCVEYGTCDVFARFVDQGKAVFSAEYAGVLGHLCASARQHGMNTIRAHPSLDGRRRACS